MVYALVLGTNGAIRGGSSPLSPTKQKVPDSSGAFLICVRT